MGLGAFCLSVAAFAPGRATAGEIDAEHIFGFTEGTETGNAGDAGMEVCHLKRRQNDRFPDMRKERVKARLNPGDCCRENDPALNLTSRFGCAPKGQGSPVSVRPASALKVLRS